MAIVINGSGTVTGISVGGLPDDIVDAGTLADNSIDSDAYVDASIDNAHLADDAVGVAELSATGTASSSTFLRGDNAWAAAGGGKVVQVKTKIIDAASGGNGFATSSTTPAVVTCNSTNLEVTGFSATSGNILFVAWEYGDIEANVGSGANAAWGVRIGSSDHHTHGFAQGSTKSSRCVSVGSILLGSDLTDETISATMTAPNGVNKETYFHNYGNNPTVTMTVMEIEL